MISLFFCTEPIIPICLQDHNIEDTHDKKISDLFDAEELKHSKYKNGNFELKHTSDPILEAKLFCVM